MSESALASPCYSCDLGWANVTWRSIHISSPQVAELVSGWCPDLVFAQHLRMAGLWMTVAGASVSCHNAFRPFRLTLLLIRGVPLLANRPATKVLGKQSSILSWCIWTKSRRFGLPQTHHWTVKHWGRNASRAGVSGHSGSTFSLTTPDFRRQLDKQRPAMGHTGWPTNSEQDIEVKCPCNKTGTSKRQIYL